MYNIHNRNMKQDGVPVTPREPYSGTLFRLRNLNPKSTQNTDVVSSITFPSLGVNCLMIMLFRLSRLFNVQVI